MTFGFRVINDFGSVQVDDTYCNLALLSKGVATSDGAAFRQVAVTVTGINPVMFLRPINGLCCVRSVANSGNTWTFTIGMAAGVTACPYYIFDSIAAPSADKYGIRVRNAAGQITFDSGYRYLRVLQFSPLPDGFPVGPGTSVAGPSGFDLAVSYSDPGWYMTQVSQPQGGSPSYASPAFGLSLAGNVCTCQGIATLTYPVPPGSNILGYGSTPLAVIFIDVTNL